MGVVAPDGRGFFEKSWKEEEFNDEKNDKMGSNTDGTSTQRKLSSFIESAQAIFRAECREEEA